MNRKGLKFRNMCFYDPCFYLEEVKFVKSDIYVCIYYMYIIIIILNLP